MNSALIVFLKYPQPGKVKTRLAEETSDISAAEFYKRCTENILNEINLVGSTKIVPILFSSDKSDVNKIIEWTNYKFKVYQQEGDSLGERMYNAFKLVFSEGFSNAIIVGTDVPDLSAVEIKYAFDQLRSTDFVIGPSPDGGYYLLGMNIFDPDLFDNIEWSTPSVFKSTIKIIDRKKSSYYLLPMLIDIDYKNDIISWIQEDKGNRNFKNEMQKLFKIIID